MYKTNDLPVFTYAGAIKPVKDHDKTMRRILMWVAFGFLVATVVVNHV